MNLRQKEMLQDLIDSKNNKIKELQQRINKAIELNEKIYDLVAFGDSENQLSELVYKLSEILKGDNND